MNEIRNNPILNRVQMVHAAVRLIAPLVECLSRGKARLLDLAE